MAAAEQNGDRQQDAIRKKEAAHKAWARKKEAAYKAWTRAEDRRQELGMTWEQVAEIANVPLVYIINARAGSIRTSVKQLVKVEGALELSHGELVRLAGMKVPSEPIEVDPNYWGSPVHKAWQRADERRQQLDMSWNRLADLAGIHRTHVAKMRSGKGRTSGDQLVKVERALDLTYGTLLRIAEKEAPALPSLHSFGTELIVKEIEAKDLTEEQLRSLLVLIRSMRGQTGDSG